MPNSKQDKPPYISKRATLEVSLDEVWELMRYHEECIEAIPKENYGRMTMAGHTLEVTAMKHQTRWEGLDRLVGNTWPK